ncbi:MAG TPA: PadR family transcriptional regulator [Clostridiales bacterium]|nr:PadR family transcriptional regulator [Clostridiales bacterium]
MHPIDELIDSLAVELRRGTLILSVLSQLKRPRYGYSLVQRMEEKNVDIEPGTLYPLLRRLEKQGLLTSQWDTSESRPRKFYVLSDQGRMVYERLKAEWDSISKQLDLLMMEDDGHE